MKLRLLRKPTAILLTSIASFTASTQVHAQTTSWLGDGTTTAWSDSANWLGGTPGGPLVELLFGTAFAASPAGANATTANNDLSGLTLQKITFETGAPAFTLTGNGFTLAAVGPAAPLIANNSTNLQSLNFGGLVSLDGGIL